MAFSFDSESNFTYWKIASAKPINTNFCGRDEGGLWISDENMLKINWRKNCDKNCTLDCVEHFVNTEYHGVTTNSRDANNRKIIISGRGIQNVAICIVRRSKLLRFIGSQYDGLWEKGDGLITNEFGSRKYTCKRKYVLVFLDENNQPLHESFVQLSTSGTFMVDFDQKLLNFRKEFLTAYCKATKRVMGGPVEQWYSLCVFRCKFGTKLVKSSYKEANGEYLESDACYVESYTIPNENNWQDMCVGRDIKVNEFITHIYDKSAKCIDYIYIINEC